MGTYSNAVVEKITRTPKSLGNQLGRWAVYHDLSVVKIARTLGVSRQTVYNWFTGTEVFKAYRPPVENMLKVLSTSPNGDVAWRRVCEVFNQEP